MRSAPWIVYAADVPLAPLVHGNRVRVAQIVEALRAAGFQVAYLYWERDAREGDVEAMRTLVDELVVVRREHDKFGKRSLRLRRQIAHALSKLKVIGESAWWRLVESRDHRELCPDELRERLALLLDSRPVAALIAAYANLAPLADVARSRGVFSIVDTHDVMFERAEALRVSGVKPTGLLVSQGTEAAWLARVDLVVAIQEREARTLRLMVDPKRVLTIEHGVRVPAGFDPTPCRERSLVILGSNNRPNQHGLEWFLSQVWPLVLRAVPDATLLVFGPLSRTSACSGPRVESCGDVSDVSEAYARARVVVNPARVGSGLKIKTVEALAFGKPLVTTTVGADGLEGAAGSAFQMSDDPAQFAAYCASALTDDAIALRFAVAGRAFARERFAPERVYAPLVDAIRTRSVISAP